MTALPTLQDALKAAPGIRADERQLLAQLAEQADEWDTVHDVDAAALGIHCGLAPGQTESILHSLERKRLVVLRKAAGGRVSIAILCPTANHERALWA